MAQYYDSANSNFSLSDYQKAIELCQVNKSDSVWVGISSILVMLMIPSVGFVYAGLVNHKSMSAVLAMCFAIFSITTIVWTAIGYSLVFGDSLGGFIGNTRYVLLLNLANFKNKCLNQFNPAYCYKFKPYWESCGIPEFLMFFFQSKFAGFSSVIVIGAASERMYVKYTLLFIFFWSIIVFCPIGHWIWNAEGFLFTLGARDFAGGLAVHVAAGFSALVMSYFLGKRKNYDIKPEISNFPYTILGIMLLWFGWFGFNGGSSYAIDITGVLALVNTNISASMNIIVWISMDFIIYKKFSAVGIAMASISGLVSITPGAGYVSPQISYVFGTLSGFVTWLLVFLRKKYKLYDDLDVFACHGIAGILGIILTGLFANKTVNPNLPYSGLVYAYIKNEPNKLFLAYQFCCIIIVSAYASVMTYAILFILSNIFTIQSKSQEEIYYDHITLCDDFQKSKNSKIEVDEVIR